MRKQDLLNAVRLNAVAERDALHELRMGREHGPASNQTAATA